MQLAVDLSGQFLIGDAREHRGQQQRGSGQVADRRVAD
jgi:hypothetical protein